MIKLDYTIFFTKNNKLSFKGIIKFDKKIQINFPNDVKGVKKVASTYLTNIKSNKPLSFPSTFITPSQPLELELSYEFNDPKQFTKYQDERIIDFDKDGELCTFPWHAFLPIASSNNLTVSLTNKSHLTLFVSSVGKCNSNKTIEWTTFQNALEDTNLFFTNNYCLNKNIYILTNMAFLQHLPTGTFPKLCKKLNSYYTKCQKFTQIKDYKDLPYIVSFNFDKQNDKKQSGISGEGGYYSFKLFIEKYDLQQFMKNDLNIIYHEMYHQFNVSGTKEDMYWMSEGFTEFFSFYLGFKPSMFNKLIKKSVMNYYSNPYRNDPNTIMTNKAFWNNRLIEKLPYTKGCAFAYYLYKKNPVKFFDNYKKLLNEIYNGCKLTPITNYKIIQYFGYKKEIEKYIFNGSTIPMKTHIKELGIKKLPKRSTIGADIDHLLYKRILRNLSPKYKSLGLFDGKIEYVHIDDKYDIDEFGHQLLITQNSKTYRINI
jgi:hypothetical protein